MKYPYIIIALILLFPCLDAPAQNRTTVDDILDLFSRGQFTEAYASLSSWAKVSNDSKAYFLMGQCLENGYGVETNPQQAFANYRKAAEKGLAIAQYTLAVCYNNGVGTPVNLERSQYWNDKAKGRFLQSDLNLIPQAYNQGLNALLAASNNSGGNSQVNLEQDAIHSNMPLQPKDNNPQVIVVNVPATPYVKEEPIKEEIQPSDIDTNIPINPSNKTNKFALVIANENYQEVSSVNYALNDGDVFAKYCVNTLGIPNSNIRVVKDGTYNNIKREINRLTEISEVYKGDLEILIYYAGHGYSDESTKEAYMVPVDGFINDLSTCYKLSDIYSAISKTNPKKCVVLIDACFSGANRGDGMLVSARGISMKPKKNVVDGNMIILSASQGDETAFPLHNERHGIFSYYLMKYLQMTNGNCKLGNLYDYIEDNVKKQSIVINGKAQHPSANTSSKLGETWRQLDL